MRKFTQPNDLQIAINAFLELHDIVYINEELYDCKLSCTHVQEKAMHFDVYLRMQTDTGQKRIIYAFSRDRHDTEIEAWFYSNGFIFPS